MADEKDRPVTEAEKFATDGDGDATAEPVNGSPGAGEEQRNFTPEDIFREYQQSLAEFVIAVRQHRYRAGATYDQGAFAAKLDRLDLQLGVLFEHLGRCGLNLTAYQLLASLRAKELVAAMQDAPRIQTLQ